jgi:hypothetical protein
VSARLDAQRRARGPTQRGRRREARSERGIATSLLAEAPRARRAQEKKIRAKRRVPLRPSGFGPRRGGLGTGLGVVSRADDRTQVRAWPVPVSPRHVMLGRRGGERRAARTLARPCSRANGRTVRDGALRGAAAARATSCARRSPRRARPSGPRRWGERASS